MANALVIERELGSGSYADCFRSGQGKYRLRTLTGMAVQALQQLTGFVSLSVSFRPFSFLSSPYLFSLTLALFFFWIRINFIFYYGTSWVSFFFSFFFFLINLDFIHCVNQTWNQYLFRFFKNAKIDNPFTITIITNVVRLTFITFEPIFSSFFLKKQKSPSKAWVNFFFLSFQMLSG